jgi:hypothetical protein
MRPPQASPHLQCPCLGTSACRQCPTSRRASKMRLRMCVLRLGALCTVLNPTGFEVRASLTSPRMHPNGIFDKNAQFCQRDISIPGDFFWILSIQENTRPPFFWHTCLSGISMPGRLWCRDVLGLQGRTGWLAGGVRWSRRGSRAALPRPPGLSRRASGLFGERSSSR